MAAKALSAAQLAAVQAVARAVEGLGEPGAAGTAVMVAVSGGTDSLVLLAAARLVAARRSISCRAVTVDHRLQPGSDGVAARTAAAAAGLGADCSVIAVDVTGSGGMEAAARAARYEALEAEARPGEWVLLGHTLDDQAETVLLGLARGSGTRSLAGMPPRRGRFLRPFLGVRRAVLARAAADWELAPHHDPHNDDPRFARVRVRHTVLPLLERELGPGVAEALARTAGIARSDADLLDSLAAEVLDPADCAATAALPPALRTRVLLRWLRDAGAGDIAARHVAAVGALVTDWHGQTAVDVPGLTVSRVAGRLVARPNTPPGPPRASDSH